AALSLSVSNRWLALQAQDRAAPESGQGRFGLLNDGTESLLVVHGQVGQHFAVQADFSLAQTGDQTAVAQAVGAAGGVDTGNPQRAELALALAAVTVGILARLDDRLLGDPEHPRTGAVVAFGLLQNFPVTAMRRYTTFDTGHVLFPSSDVQTRNMRSISGLSD